MSRFDRSDLTVIDSASHLLPTEPEKTDYKFIDEEIGEPLYSDPNSHWDAISSAGIDGAVLSDPTYLGHDDAEETRDANEAMLELTNTWDQYYALAAIPTDAGPEAAAEELDRALEAGLNGGALETLSPEGREIHHEEMAPILEVADRWEAPILVHPKLYSSINSDVLDDAWLINAILGREVGIATSLLKTVHTGVLDRYPNLNLVFHHTGGNVASFMGRVHNQLQKFPPEVWFDGNPPEPVKSWPDFRAQLQDRVYLDTAGYYGYGNTLESALSIFPPSQLLFGTDFPFEARTTDDIEAFLDTIEATVSRQVAEDMFAGNVLDLLVNVD